MWLRKRLLLKTTRRLFDKKEQMRTMNVIRSHRHEIYTEQVNKIALSSNDDKRVTLDDHVHTLAYGHYSLIFLFK